MKRGTRITGWKLIGLKMMGWALAGAGLASGLTIAAQAQELFNHNSNAPVDYGADRIEVQDAQNRVVLTGNVDIQQAGLQLRAARMTVAYRNVGGIRIDRIDANGGVSVVKGSETARGDVGIYDLNARTITLIGNVALNQNGNTLNGGRLTIDLRTGRAAVDGRASGGAPGTTTGPDGRVTGTFSVPQSEE